ncbi:TraR/DksA family transcriptional regulator [Acidobacteriota bacterium]
MDKREKQKFEKLLLAKKQELVESLSEFVNESKKVDSGIAQDVGDKAESSYTKEFLLNLSDKERTQLILVDEALKRLEKGEFKICLACEKEIGKKRLDAVPWARHCIECQEKEEKGIL